MPEKPDQPPPRMSDSAAAARRRSVVRTALVVGAIAVAIYVGFILTGVLGQ